ncbi:MAG: TerC family protein [Candidatus Omnitrophica bacterium]|nr:TerC family protein [Candidatus Omnitrophota bacterium]
MVTAWHWITFNVFIVSLLLLDLFVFQRKTHEVKPREAVIMAGFWIALAGVFNVLIWMWRGHDAGLEFLTGYLIEKALSVDNLFVFLLIFSFFKVDRRYQHKVLFWGILGAMIMRALFILAGTTLIHHFHWVMYVFGAMLIFTAISLAMEKDKEVRPEKNLVLKIFRKLMPVTPEYHGEKFFIRVDNRLWATPLFVVLLAVETTDVIFAIDSIPAIFAVTTDPFIVYTSNMFAILGLRSLFFALSAFMVTFHHLHYGLSFILLFIGVKMLIVDFYKIPIWLALSVIVVTLIVSVVASIMDPKVQKELEKELDPGKNP